MSDYLKQESKPLFPNFMWSRPETKQGAGKLLIIGGQAQEFIHVAEAYAAAEKAGAGSVRVIMPDSTKKVTKLFPHIEHSESNNSGSFARTALADLLSAADWSDGVLLAGDLGKNSETTLMLDSFVDKYPGLLVISSLALHSLSVPTLDLFMREQTCLAIDLSILQKFVIDLELKRAVTSTIGDVELAAVLHEITSEYPVVISLKHNEKIWAAYKGNVGVAIRTNELSHTEQSARAAVWVLQHPAKPFESAISAMFE